MGREPSVDDREARFVETARLISQLQAGLLEDLEHFDRNQMFTADGARNLSEWTAQKLDLGVDTARRLVRAMRRTQDAPVLRKLLAAGLVSFDRAEALSKLAVPVESELDIQPHLDISGLRRMAADEIEITAEDEVGSAADRYLMIQPNLDESWWNLRGGLDGPTGAVIDQTLRSKADQLPEQPDGTTGSSSWRMATALYELASGGRTPSGDITVFVNAERAVPSNGRAGVRLLAGPRVGADALKAILCDSTTSVTVNTDDGIPLRYGRSSRTIPPALRKAALATTGGHCAIDGCDSRYRVEVHHRIAWSEGGRTDPDNLLPLCWYHHHITIHEKGFQPYKHPDHERWRLRRPDSVRPPQRKPQG